MLKIIILNIFKNQKGELKMKSGKEIFEKAKEHKINIVCQNMDFVFIGIIGWVNVINSNFIHLKKIQQK